MQGAFRARCQREPGGHLAGAELRIATVAPELRGAPFHLLAESGVNLLHVLERKLDWEGFLSELTTAYPWLADCLPCPGGGTFSGWSRDWSRSDWTLEDGTDITYER